MLKVMAERGERKPKGGNQSLSHDAISLPDLGIDPDQSSRWQRVASVPAEERKAYYQEARKAGAT